MLSTNRSRLLLQHFTWICTFVVRVCWPFKKTGRFKALVLASFKMQDNLGKMNFPLLTMVWVVPSGHLWISFLVVNFLRGNKHIYMTLSLNKCYHELNSWMLWQKYTILLTAGLSVVGVGKKLTYSVHRDGKRNSSSHFQSIYAYYISILLKAQNRGAAVSVVFIDFTVLPHVEKETAVLCPFLPLHITQLSVY